MSKNSITEKDLLELAKQAGIDIHVDEPVTPTKKEQAQTEKSKKKELKAHKKEVREDDRAISDTILSVFPIKDEVTDGDGSFFVLDNGELLDILQIAGKDYSKAMPADKNGLVDNNTFFHREYKDAIKWVSLDFPTNVERQLDMLQIILDDTEETLIQKRRIIVAKIEQLEAIKQNLQSKQYFFFIYAKSVPQLHALKKLIAKSRYDVVEVESGKKRKVLWRLNNPCQSFKL